MIPAGVTFRIRLLPKSAMKRFPDPSTATPDGPASRADVAGPPSPLKPDVPLPATVVIKPDVPTVKPVNGSDVPAGVVTRTVRTPVAAANAMVIVMGRLVGKPPLESAAVTPVPLNVTAVAPQRLVPWMSAERVVPCAPHVEVMPVITGMAPDEPETTLRMR